MENKISDRQRLLKLIDGRPEPPVKPEPAPAQPEAAKAVTAPLPGTRGIGTHFQKLGLEKKDIILFAILILAGLSFFISKLDLGGKLPAVSIPPPSASPAIPAFPDAPVPSRLPADAATGALLGLRLVGVDWGENPVALMEDTKTGKTYFVQQNDTILGSRVKNIQKDRVVVAYQGQNVELR